MKPNEYAVISEVAREPGQTQREISRKVGLSLGMTNALLLRLARKGYIKMKQLDWKRTEYLLTLKGAMEKTRKSYAYALHTIRLFQHILESVQSLMRSEYEQGTRQIIIVAWPETVKAISSALAEINLPGLQVEDVATFKKLGSRPGTIFIATEEPAPKPAEGQRFIHLLEVNDLKFKYPD